MPTVDLPRSGLSSRHRPYAPHVHLEPSLRGKKLLISLTLERHDAPAGGVIAAETETTVEHTDLEVVLPTERLASGDYAGQLILSSDGDVLIAQHLAFHHMADRVVEPVPFAIYAVPFPDDPAGVRERLDEVQAAGINLICQHMDEIGALSPVLDEAARRGIRFMPSTNLLRQQHRARTVPEEWRDKLSYPGHKRRPTVCRAHPAVRERAAADLEAHLRDYQSHPAFSGLVYYGDDLFLSYRCDQGTVAISCYCDVCRSAFEAEAGYAPPTTTEPVAGLVDPDHPWLRWMRFRCAETFGGLIRRLEEVRRRVAPTVRMGLCHGFPYAPFTQLPAGIYGPLTQPTAVVSSYAYPYLRSPRVDLIPHYEFGRMGNRDKDIWMLGAINSNWTNYPAWQVYQNFWNMLAAGYRFIAYFAWHDFVTAVEKGYGAQVEECKHALSVCGARKDWLLPVTRHWRPLDAPFAVLFSFTTAAFDVAPENRGHLHLERVLSFYREALRRQVPMEIVSEEEVLEGRLSGYEAVCLRDVRALPRDVHRKLEEYAAQGGTVMREQDLMWCYDENHPAVHVEGEIEASPETLVAMLGDRRPPEVTVSSEYVTVRRMQAEDVEYVVLVNNFADQYQGFRFHYWDKRVQENYAHMAHVRDEAVETEVRFRERGRTIADIAAGQIIGHTDGPLPVHLEPSWGRVLALLPCRQVRLEVDGPESATPGESVTWHIRTVSDADEGVAGAFTARAAATAPSGEESGWNGWFSVLNGSAEVDFTIPINAEVGDWTICFEGGFPRRAISRTLTVSGPRKDIAIGTSWVRACGSTVASSRAGAAIERLRLLFSNRGEDRVFARMKVRLPAERRERLGRMAEAIPMDEFPPVEAVLPLWAEYLSHFEKVEDDWVPGMYPRRYDQGLYGTLFGAEMRFERVDGPGWVCSTTLPLDGLDYPELLARAARPQDEWLQRLEADLRTCTRYFDGRFGVSIPITIDALNLAMQIRGSQSLLDLVDRPADLKALLQAGVDLNTMVAERLHAAIGPQPDGGVCDFFNAGWLPARGIPMSVDAYHFCHPDVYAEFGLPWQQQLLDHFGAANFHIHGNGRRLLPELSRLKGTVSVYMADDGSEVSAFEALHELKRQAGSLILVVSCAADAFVAGLSRGDLPGGVYYVVGGLGSVDEANRLMDQVRSYRT